MLILTPPSVIVVDGDNFTREMMNCFFNRERVGDQIRLLEEVSQFAFLTEEKLKTLNPSFILFNYQSSFQDCKKFLRRIRNVLPEIKFVAYFFVGNEFEIQLLLKAGVNGILGSQHSIADLLWALDALSTENYYENDLLTKARLLQTKRMLHIEDDGLTLQEVAVMRLVSIGLSRNFIANILRREKHTVGKDISNIHSKTNTKNDIQIQRYCMLHGFINFELLGDAITHPYISSSDKVSNLKS